MLYEVITSGSQVNPREVVMNPFIHFADNLSTWIGKAFSWCIMVLTFATCYEVFVRYVLNAPTAWAFDMSVQMSYNFV